VELVEPLGSETIFHLTTGAHAFVSRVGPAERLEPGQTVQVTFDPAQFRFFDAVTERAIA